MPDRLVERGIGETRIVSVQDGQILEARIAIDGAVPAGTVLEAALVQAGSPGIARVGDTEYLLPGGAAGVSQGAKLFIEVTREAISGTEPWKRPLARLAQGPVRAITDRGGTDLVFPAARDVLEEAGWSDLLDEARTGLVRFAGGELRISPTPAMTLIDVDGQLPPAELALAGALAAARTIRRHDIGGSIGIDLPTVAGKTPRHAVDNALEAALPEPFERTAMNGFGFVQIVRPRRHASLFELAQDRAGFEARALLRRAAFERGGAMRLVAHPAVATVIESRPGWIDALSGQIGGLVTLRPDAAVPIHGGYDEKP